MEPEESGGQPQQNQDKVITLQDGTRHIFPSDATPDEINQILSLSIPKGQSQPQQPSNAQFGPDLGNVLNVLRPYIAGAGGTVAATGATFIPGVGQTGVAQGAADISGYAATDYALKKGITALGGKVDNEGFDESVKDALLNAVGAKIINGTFKGIRAMRNANVPDLYKFSPTSSQALEAYGYHKLATSAKFLEDFGVPAAKAAALDKSGGAGFTQALAFANSLNGRTAGTNLDPVKLSDKIKSTLMGGLSADVPEGGILRTYAEQTGQVPKLHVASEEALDILNGGKNPFGPLDEVIKNPDKLSKVLKVGAVSGTPGLNVRKDLAAYQFMRTVQDATVQDAKGVMRLDPDKLAKVWNNKDIGTSLDLLYGKQGRQNLLDFMQNIATTQDKPSSYNGARLISYGGGGFHIANSLLHGNFTGAGLASAIFLTPAALGTLLVNPNTSKAITKMAGNLPLEQSKQFTSKMLMSALQSVPIALEDGLGGKKWGTFKDDKFVPYE